MRTLQPIKLIDRAASFALEPITADQMNRIDELALEHF